MAAAGASKGFFPTRSVGSKIGAKWTDDEEKQLLAEVIAGKTTDEIATIHKRGVGGIKIRLSEMVYRIHISDAHPSPEEISGMLKLPVEEITEMLKGQEGKTVKKEEEKKEKTFIKTDLAEALKEIKEILLRIEEKIDSK